MSHVVIDLMLAWSHSGEGNFSTPLATYIVAVADLQQRKAAAQAELRLVQAELPTLEEENKGWSYSVYLNIRGESSGVQEFINQRREAKKAVIKSPHRFKLARH